MWGKKENFALPAQNIHITQFQAHCMNVNVNSKMIPLIEVTLEKIFMNLRWERFSKH